MLQRLEELSDAIAKMLAPFTGGDGLRKLELFFAKLTALTKAAMPIVGGLASAFGKLVDVGVFLAGGLDVAAGGQPKSPDALRAAMRNLFGPAPWESQGGGKGATPPIAVSVQVDARGASKDDAEHIAEKAKDAAVEAVTDALDRAAIQRGAQ
jgi:hypothetical protein